MNILMFGTSNYFLPCALGNGGAQYVHNIILGLTNKGHNIQALILDKGKIKKRVNNEYGYKAYRISTKKRLSFLLPALSFLKLVLRHKPHLIFLSNLMSYDANGVLILSKILRIPFVIAIAGLELWHLELPHPRDRFVAKSLLRNAKAVCAISNFTAEQIIERSKISLKNVKAFWPGIDNTRFNRSNIDNEIIKEYGLEDKKIILTVSGLRKRKGIDNVIRALPAVIEKVSNAIYLIVGDGGEMGNLKGLVRSLNLENYVLFIGNIPNEKTPHFYNIADVFIMTSYVNYQDCVSDFEGFGLVFLEANACGVPTIAGRSGGMVDAVLDGVTGFLVDPFDLSEIANKLVTILTDSQLRKKLGENGQRRVLRDFTLAAVGQRYDKFLNQIVSKSKQARC